MTKIQNLFIEIWYSKVLGKDIKMTTNIRNTKSETALNHQIGTSVD